MRYVIIGSNGFIAKRIVQELNETYPYVLTSSRPANHSVLLDLADPDNFDFNLISDQDVILFLAAISSPDICEKDFDKAYQINVYGTKSFIQKCIDRGAKVIFFSSDTVYGIGSHEVIFNESSELNPIGKYAEMKLAVEENFNNQSLFKVFRLSYVFANEDKFTSYLQKCNKNDEIVEVFHPIYRNIVYVKDVIRAVIALSNNWSNWKNQVFNLCGPDCLSRIDMVCLLKEVKTPRMQYKVIEPKIDFFKSRPRIIKMESLYLNQLLGRKPISLKSAMQEEFSL